MFVIVVDAAQTFLLICADYEPYAPLIRQKTVIDDIFHSIKAADNRSLVIQRAAPVYPSVLYNSLKRRCFPARSRFHDIDMRKYAYHLFSASYGYLSRIAVIILCLHTHRLGKPYH